MSTLTVEECELLSDSKYRAYISQVEKALRSFENTSEWADLISALGKLNKVRDVLTLKTLFSMLFSLQGSCDTCILSFNVISLQFMFFSTTVDGLTTNFHQ